MQQNIMRNAVQDGFLTRAQEDGATASIQSYAVARAEAYQQSIYNTQGGVAATAISYMKIVIEILFYAIFPFVTIMICFPGATSVLRSYFYGLVWLQTWAPLYSILNMIVAVYCTEHTFSAATTLNDPALTFDTIPALGEAAQAVSSYANYAMMSVPFLSWGLLKYGGGAMAQLSTTLSQPTQSAAGMAAQEATSGNFSMGVRNFDSTSRHNINSFKQDENLNVASGSSSFQAGDGSLLRITSDGTGIIDKNASISRTGVNFTNRSDLSNSMQHQAAKSFANATTSRVAHGETVNSMFEMMMNYANSRGESSSHDRSIGTDESNSVSESIHRADNIVKSYAKVTGLSENESRSSLHTLSAGGGFNVGLSVQKGIPFFGLNANVSGGPSAQIGYDYKGQSSDVHGKSVSTASQDQLQMVQDYKEAMDKITRISNSDSFKNSSSEANNFSEGFNSRLSEAQNYQREIQNSLTESESWQRSANLVNSSSTGVVEDISQDFVNYGMKQLDSNGYAYNLDGLNNAMNDPAQREKLIDGFMQSNKDKLFQLYSDNEATNPNKIKDDYYNIEKNNQYEQQVKNHHDGNANKVIEHATNIGIDKPINQEGKKEMQKRNYSLNQIFSEKTLEIINNGKGVKQLVQDYNENHPMGKE